jgi:hypothetical protein
VKLGHPQWDGSLEQKAFDTFGDPMGSAEHNLLGSRGQHKYVGEIMNFYSYYWRFKFLLQVFENYQSYKISLYDINMIVTEFYNWKL